MALKSAAGAHVRAEPARSGGIDHFDVHEASRPGDAAYPWDLDAAEALTRLYEIGENGFVRRTPDPETFRPAPASASAAISPVAPVAPTAAAQAAAVETRPPQADLDKLWLEEK